MSEDAGIEPMTFATLALSVRRSNHSDISFTLGKISLDFIHFLIFRLHPESLYLVSNWYGKQLPVLVTCGVVSGPPRSWKIVFFQTCSRTWGTSIPWSSWTIITNWYVWMYFDYSNSVVNPEFLGLFTSFFTKKVLKKSKRSRNQGFS